VQEPRQNFGAPPELIAVFSIPLYLFVTCCEAGIFLPIADEMQEESGFPAVIAPIKTVENEIR
jgi:hypothetical protein